MQSSTVSPALQSSTGVAGDEDTEDKENERDYSEEGRTAEELLVLETLINHCPPITSRHLFWNWTRAGELAIQPCPGGSSGFAKWRCGSDAEWYSSSPDLGECQSHWLARLEARLAPPAAVLAVSAELAELTAARTLYGGDLGLVATVLQSLAHTARQQLFAMVQQEDKELLAAQLSEHTLKVASNLLEESQMLAWADLEPAERAQVGSNLVLAIQENSFFLADTINVEKNIIMMETNLLASVRIMRARDLYDQQFQSQAGGVALTVPAESLVQNSENGAVRLVFFHYTNLDHVLPSSTNGVKFLNSQIASAALSKGHSTLLAHPVTARFEHLQTEGMGSPSCVWWDYVSRTWAEDGCWVEWTNSSATSCQCNRLGNLAVLMEEATYAAPHQDATSPTTMTVVIAAIVSIVICAVTVTATFIIFRRFSKGICKNKIPCLETKESSPGYYPYLSSSNTSTTITATTPDKNTSSSQYFLNNECQVLRPLMITPIGPNSTIYRATFANGQQAHVIPIDSAEQQSNKYQFRPITPSASHIYMEIDPVYNSETMSDILVSDTSDDDLKRSCEEAGRVQGVAGRRGPGPGHHQHHSVGPHTLNLLPRCDNTAEFSGQQHGGTHNPGLARGTNAGWPQWAHQPQPAINSVHTVFQ